MRKKEVGDAADDPDFDESDDELNISACKKRKSKEKNKWKKSK